jgi:HSP20 family protein
MGEGLHRAWETVAEGWRYLVERASDALTRFQPTTRHGTLETAEERRIHQGCRWGLIAMDMGETDSHLIVRLEVPGMDQAAFDIVVQGDALLVRGEKRAERDQTVGRYHVLECAYGSFERAVVLPVSVAQDGAKAAYRQGILTIELPKLRPSGARRITVESE